MRDLFLCHSISFSILCAIFTDEIFVVPRIGDSQGGKLKMGIFLVVILCTTANSSRIGLGWHFFCDEIFREGKEN